jgi:hypothetical protein
MGFRLSDVYKLSEVYPHYTSRRLAEQALDDAGGIPT